VKKTIKKLTLKTETIKQLNDVQLGQVAGGMTGSICVGCSGTVCPSGGQNPCPQSVTLCSGLNCTANTCVTACGSCQGCNG
jgi:hypothetical protein